MTERTVRNWIRAVRETARPPGRPGHELEKKRAALWQVARERRMQGKCAGERPLWRALRERGMGIPLRLVRWALRLFKARDRRVAGWLRERERQRIEVAEKDVIWSLDATHLGRTGGKSVQAELVREVASALTLHVSVGAPSRDEDVVALLEAIRRERGVLPLVLSTDGGYVGGELSRYLVEHKVLHLVNVPRTPEHNSWIERTIQDVKGESELGKGRMLEALPERRVTLVGGVLEQSQGCVCVAEPGAACEIGAREELPCWCRRLVRGVRRLNEGRLRASRGWRTAAQLDSLLARGDDRVRREELYAAACEDVALAVAGAKTVREERRARREAILCTLERFGLITRTRGGRPSTAAKPEGEA